MYELVPVQSGRPLECFSASATNKRLLIAMCSLVVFQFRTLAKSFATRFAMIRFLSGMQTHVSIHLDSSQKLLSANCAGVILLMGVNCHMSLKVCASSITTSTVLACIRPFIQM